MSEEVVFFGIVSHGELRNRTLQARIRELEGKRFECTLRERRSYRTNPQNRAFHGPVVGPITRRLRELGWTGYDGTLIRAAEVKELLKAKFLTAEIVDRETGEIFTFVRDTHRLTKSEFSDLIHDCITWAREYLGITIVIGWEELAEEGFEVR